MNRLLDKGKLELVLRANVKDPMQVQGARDEASEGVYSLETHQVGLQKVFITKSPVAPPSPGIRPGHSGGPIGPTAKGLCEYQARFPYSLGLVSKGQTMKL